MAADPTGPRELVIASIETDPFPYGLYDSLSDAIAEVAIDYGLTIGTSIRPYEPEEGSERVDQRRRADTLLQIAADRTRGGVTLAELDRLRGRIAELKLLIDMEREENGRLGQLLIETRAGVVRRLTTGLRARGIDIPEDAHTGVVAEWMVDLARRAEAAEADVQRVRALADQLDAEWRQLERDPNRGLDTMGRADGLREASERLERALDATGTPAPGTDPRHALDQVLADLEAEAIERDGSNWLLAAGEAAGLRMAVTRIRSALAAGTPADATGEER